MRLFELGHGAITAWKQANWSTFWHSELVPFASTVNNCYNILGELANRKKQWQVRGEGALL